MTARSRRLFLFPLMMASLGTIAVIALTDATFCQFTLHVPRSGPGDAPPGYKDVAIRAADGVTLRAWFAPAKQSEGNCVLVLHGIGDSRRGSAGFAPLFLENHYSVLMPDSRGHGSSGGELVTYGLLEKYDVLAWASWARAQHCDKLYGLGESLGGAILIQSAGLGSDFKAIAAECAYSDLRAIASYRVRQITGLPEAIGGPLIIDTSMIYARLRYGLDLSQVSPVKTIAQARTPVLLIHGLLDTRTPYWHSQALEAANPHNSLWLVPGAGHTGANSANPQEFREKVLTWFQDHSQ